MNDFPLNPFLVSLATGGIRPTVRDYERISLALQSGGSWTITRFRDMLLALLAKDEDQQELFLRRFDDFFKAEFGPEDIRAGIDVDQALAELKQLAQQQPPPLNQCPPARNESGNLSLKPLSAPGPNSNGGWQSPLCYSWVC